MHIISINYATKDLGKSEFRARNERIIFVNNVKECKIEGFFKKAD